MAIYRVLVAFSDLNDKNYVYHPGDKYPREGIDVSVDRLTSLSSSSNRLGKPIIELIPQATATEPVAEPAPAKEEKKPKAKSASKSAKSKEAKK